MTKYFENPNFSSLDDSLQDPLRELDLNDSDSFLQLSPAKRSTKLERSQPNYRKNGRTSRHLTDKENAYGVDKLPVFHRAPHGEQHGTLIVRHYMQNDSKCIQCRNCGIFFNASSFLQHCHDEFGKRSQCKSIQLQLGLDTPTTQQKDAWNNFQKRLLSDTDQTIRPGSAAARHIKNLDGSPNRRNATNRDFNRRGRRSSADIPISRNSNFNAPAFGAQIPIKDDTLMRSRMFLSSSALNAADTLSISELDRDRRGGRMSSSYNITDNVDAPRRKYPYTSCYRDTDGVLPDRNERSNRTPHFQSHTSALKSPRYPTSHPWHDAIRQGPRGNQSYGNELISQTPITTFSNDAFTDDFLKPASENIFRPLPEYHPKPISLSNTQENEQTCGGSSENPQSLISQACILLQQASEKLTKNNGQNSNAWRKMYEEERDHRMRLEAQIRDLERELRSRKT